MRYKRLNGVSAYRRPWQPSALILGLVHHRFCRTAVNRLLLPVGAQVLSQVWQLGKGVPHLLIGVHPLVSNEGGGEAEGLAAATALVRLLPGVHDVVLDQVRAIAEGLAAVGARVGPLAGVRAPVQRQQ